MTSIVSVALCISGIITLNASTKSDNSYDYIIVGGGFSGLYTALRLGESSNSNLKIAILEKQISDNNWENSGYSRNGIPSPQHACLGGRINDFPYKCTINEHNNPYCPSDGDFPGIVWFGDCAMRYKTSQGTFFLAQELGFQNISNNPDYTYNEPQGSIGHDRGYYFFNAQQLLDAKYIDDYKNDALKYNKASEIFATALDPKNLDILCDENRNIWHSSRSYYEDITGSSSGVEFLEGVIPFKHEWAQIDAQGLLEFKDTDGKSDKGWTVYPQYGMSEFIRTIYQKIIDNNYADIYCGFQVENIQRAKKKSNRKYKVAKKGKIIFGDKIILTVPINALNEIKGLVSIITSAPEAQNWNPIEVVSCSQQFEERWWENKIPTQYFKQQQNNYDDNNNNNDIKIDTWNSNQNCMQRMENFNSNYLRSGNIIRSLYVDEGKCSKYWKGIIVGTDYNYNGIVADIIRRRQAEYFGVSFEEIPSALMTRCNIVENGWHHLSTGATYKLGNNPRRRIEEWAHQPLDDEDIFMCGAMWSVRHSWIDGSIAHCDLMMNTKLNVDSRYLPQFRFSLHSRAQCSSICIDDGGRDEIECVTFPPQAILKE